MLNALKSHSNTDGKSPPSLNPEGCGHLSRLGSGEKNLSRPSGTKVASRPSERARASQLAGHSMPGYIPFSTSRPSGVLESSSCLSVLVLGTLPPFLPYRQPRFRRPIYSHLPLFTPIYPFLAPGGEGICRFSRSRSVTTNHAGSRPVTQFSEKKDCLFFSHPAFAPLRLQSVFHLCPSVAGNQAENRRFQTDFKPLQTKFL